MKENQKSKQSSNNSGNNKNKISENGHGIVVAEHNGLAEKRDQPVVQKENQDKDNNRRHGILVAGKEGNQNKNISRDKNQNNNRNSK
jgi:hypothetical protein